MKSNRKHGKVLLEYVVVAILVIAAVLLAVGYYFGCALKNEFGVAGSAMTGSCEQAEESRATQAARAAHDAASRRESVQSAERRFMTSGESVGGSESIDRAELDIDNLDDNDGRGRSRASGKRKGN